MPPKPITKEEPKTSAPETESRTNETEIKHEQKMEQRKQLIRDREIKAIDQLLLDFWLNKTSDAQRYSIVQRLQCLPIVYLEKAIRLGLDPTCFAQQIKGVCSTLLVSRQEADEYMRQLYKSSYTVDFKRLSSDLAQKLVNSVSLCEHGGKKLFEEIHKSRVTDHPMTKEQENDKIRKHLTMCGECIEAHKTLKKGDNEAKHFIEAFPLFLSTLFESAFLDYKCGWKECPLNVSEVTLYKDGEKIKANVRALSACGRCRVVRYCSRDCQVTDWDYHSEYCKRAPPGFVIPLTTPVAEAPAVPVPSKPSPDVPAPPSASSPPSVSPPVVVDQKEDKKKQKSRNRPMKDKGKKK